MKITIRLVLLAFLVIILGGATRLETTNNLAFENQHKYKIVAGVIRNNGNGWEIIRDSGHESLHVKSVSNNNLTITIEHSFKASKVVSFMVTPDETFVKEGLTAGASVGLDKTFIYLSKSGSNAYSDPARVVSAKGNFWFYGMFIDE